MRFGYRATAVAGLGALAASVTGSPALAAPTAQQTYDAAQAAYDKADWAAAASGFAGLLPAAPGAPLNHSQAVIASRYADSLFHLDRRAEAQVWVDPAIAGLTHDADPGDLGEALLVKGDLARADYDFVGASDAFGRAIVAFGSGLDTVGVMRARVGFAEVGVTLDPSRAGEALAPLLQAPDFAKLLDRQARAEVEDLAARAALNGGDVKAASKLVRRALADSGEGGATVNVQQSYVRNDAGMIARLNHDDTEVRSDFAFSGAGHMEDEGWIGDHAGDLPVCEGSGGDIRPDDSVVMRFQIRADGRVAQATPVYASRIGLLGERFAQAVSQWRWDPDKLRAVQPFWRSTLELELRCVSRPRPTGLATASWRTALAWLVRQGLLHAPERTGDPTGDGLVVAADDPRLKSPDGPALEALARPIDAAKVQGLWDRLDAIHAPAAVYALMIQRAAGSRGGPGATARDYARWTPAFEQRFPDDPALAWLLLDQAIAWESARDFAAAAPLLARVLAMPPARLPEDDPIRKVALLHRAMGLQRAGEDQAAAASLARSGLTADQCALFDTHPVPENMSIANSAFPQEALRWGFQGYVVEAFDVADNGSVTDVRTVVAYPPYIFEPTTEAAVKQFRYFPPRLGGHAVGCDDERVPVLYRIGN